MGIKRTGVPVTYEEGLEKATAFVKSFPRGVAAALVMEHEGQLLYYECTGEPCIGFLRRYGPESKNRSMDRRPGDLPRDFPDGSPVILGSPIYAIRILKGDEWYWNWWLKDSPYRDASKDISFIVDDDSVNRVGVLVTNTDVDATLLIQFLRQTRYKQNVYTHYKSVSDKNPDIPKEDVALFLGVLSTEGTPNCYTDWRRYLLGDWDKAVTSGDANIRGTFKDGYDYNRPEVDYVFGRQPPETALNVLFQKKFGEYYLSTGRANPKYSFRNSYDYLKELLSAK